MAHERLTGKQVAQQVSQRINSYGQQEREAFITEMLNDHRSLQQSFTRLCVRWFEGMAKQSHDLRNEASVQLAKEVVKVTDKHALPFI